MRHLRLWTSGRAVAASATTIILAAACTAAEQSPDIPTAEGTSTPATEVVTDGASDALATDTASAAPTATAGPFASDLGSGGSSTTPGGTVATSPPQDASTVTGDRSEAACPATAAGAQGVTDTELVIGASRLALEVVTQIGFDPPNHDPDEYSEAMLEKVNAAGGIACRQVRVVWHEYRAHPTWDTEQQAACATWTQDHDLFAVFPLVDGPGDVLYSCLDRAGVLIVNIMGVVFRDRQGFAEIPSLIAVNSPGYDRPTAAGIHALVRQGFLTQAATIGVVHYDDEMSERVLNEVLLPTLADHGLTARTRGVTAPHNPAESGQRDAELANVALRFNLQGVDRVLFLGGDGLAKTFMVAAEDQGYRPLYGLNTIYLAMMSTSDVPHRQLHGSRGIGWLPDSDGYPRPPDPSWPARTACLEFFHDEGFDLDTVADRSFALGACGAVGFLRTAVEATNGPLSGEAVLDAVAGLGDQYRSPIIDRTRFGPGRRDGAATYRDVAYQPDCRCFVAEGPSRILP